MNATELHKLRSDYIAACEDLISAVNKYGSGTLFADLKQRKNIARDRYEKGMKEYNARNDPERISLIIERLIERDFNDPNDR